MQSAISRDCTCSYAGLKTDLICLPLTWLNWCLSAQFFHARAVACKVALCGGMLLILGQDSGIGVQAEYLKI